MGEVPLYLESGDGFGLGEVEGNMCLVPILGNSKKGV